jgi:hypothetical protein
MQQMGVQPFSYDDSDSKPFGQEYSARCIFGAYSSYGSFGFLVAWHIVAIDAVRSSTHVGRTPRGCRWSQPVLTRTVKFSEGIGSAGQGEATARKIA